MTKLNINGWLLLNKPTNITSTKALAIVKRIFNAKKAGHAGTLDPLANGLLPIALGEATKTINFVMDAMKEYEFTVAFGQATTTDDLEGEVTNTNANRPNIENLTKIIPLFTGNITQIPPIYSALKIDGKRSYDLARSGEIPILPERQVNIYKLELINYQGTKDKIEQANFKVQCSKGTYIRSLARDMAISLSTYGHVITLTRTQVGNFFIHQSISLDNINNIVHNDAANEYLKSVDIALDDIPVLSVSAIERDFLRNGVTIKIENSDLGASFKIARATNDEKLIAIGNIESGYFKPIRVFNL